MKCPLTRIHLYEHFYPSIPLPIKTIAEVSEHRQDGQAMKDSALIRLKWVQVFAGLGINHPLYILEAAQNYGFGSFVFLIDKHDGFFFHFTGS